MSKILIKNGKLISPRSTTTSDVLIEDDKIKKIGNVISESDAEVIDASGKYIFPGFLDAHTHMGIPVRDTDSSDDFDSGTKAALHGGVTTIIDFTVQEKGEMLMDSLQRRKKQAAGKASVDYSFHCNITDLQEQNLTEIPEIIKEGILSFKVFTAYREAGMQLNDRQILEVMWKVKQAKGTVMVHAENGDLVEFLTEKYVKFKKTTPYYHALSRPAEAEIEAVARLTSLNKLIHCPLYFVHLSTAEAVQYAAMAKQNKQPVYLETCPQYLMFDHSVYDREDGQRFIAAPPFRTEKDNKFLWKALNQGVIDTVGTDHCPFTIEQKDAEAGLFHKTPNGIPGVETLFSILYNEGVLKKRLSLQRLVSLISEEPARLFGLFPRKGFLAEKSDADIVIFDPRGDGQIQAENLHSNCDWSPYEGLKTKGKIESVMLRGSWLLKEGQLQNEQMNKGQFLPALQ